jgi:lipopolysaccharide export system protein LptA
MLFISPILSLSLALAPLRDGVPLPPAATAVDPAAAPAESSVVVARRAAPRRLPPPPAPVPGETELVLRAQQIDYADSGRQIVARGDVRMVYGPDTLAADRATADLQTSEILAEGNVILTRGMDVVRGGRVRYNWETREGVAEEASTVQRGVIVRAKTLTTTLQQSEALHASLTTCDLPRPHYRLTARRVTLIPGRRIVVHGASVYLLGAKIFYLPRYETSLRRGEGGHSPFPSFGYNSHYGVLLRKELTLVDQPAFLLDLDAAYAFRRGFLGGVHLTRPGSPALTLALTTREEAPSQRIRFLEVDRLPEVGVTFSSRPHPRRPREVPSVAQNVRVRGDQAEGPRWEWSAQATLGEYRQRRGPGDDDRSHDVDGGRFDVRAALSRRNLRLGPVTLGSLRLLARTSWYDTGDRFSLFGLGLGHTWRAGRNVGLSLEYFANGTNGESPFQFDSPDIRDELRPGLQFHFGGTALEWIGRYDLGADQFFDHEFVLARTFHCLRPRFTYRTRRRQIGFDLQVVGLQTGSAARDESPTPELP